VVAEMNQQKQCPKCGRACPLQAGQCLCGRVFKTRFDAAGNPIQNPAPPTYVPPPPPQQAPTAQAAGKVIQMLPGTHSITWAVILGVLCIPGIGQMFNHQFGKGGAALIITLALAAQQATTYFSQGYTDGVISLVQTVLWIGLAVDAGLIASRLRRGEPIRDWQFF
jgi:hypothetical protein